MAGPGTNTLIAKQKTVNCKGECGRTLPQTDEYFYKSNTCASGLTTICKKCTNTKQRQRNKRNRAASKTGTQSLKARIADAKYLRQLKCERDDPLDAFDVSCLREKVKRQRTAPTSIDQEVSSAIPKE